MSKKSSSIGHFARIPLHVAHAEVSETAKGLWRELAFISSPESPIVWVRQETFAERMNRSVKTIQRALRELVAAGLVSFAGWWQGRYKRYKLAWKNFLSQDSQKCPTTSDMDVQVPETPVSEHVGHSCPPINKEAQSSEQKNSFSAHVQKWQEHFKCLDGKNGRPSLKECIDQGLGHKSRHNYDNPIVFLETWLRNAAARWMDAYLNDQPKSSSQSLRDWERKRAEREAEEFKRYWPIIKARDEAREQQRMAELRGATQPFMGGSI